MFCPDFYVAGMDGQTAQIETATSKIYAMPKGFGGLMPIFSSPQSRKYAIISLRNPAQPL